MQLPLPLAVLLFAAAATALPPYHGPHTATDDGAAAPTPSQDGADDSSSAPSPTCTVDVIGNPPVNKIGDKTCTVYAETVTATSETDCGGCAIGTLSLGHGPVVPCTTHVTLPVTTTTEVACATSLVPVGY